MLTLGVLKSYIYFYSSAIKRPIFQRMSRWFVFDNVFPTVICYSCHPIPGNISHDIQHYSLLVRYLLFCCSVCFIIDRDGNLNEKLQSINCIVFYQTVVTFVACPSFMQNTSLKDNYFNGICYMHQPTSNSKSKHTRRFFFSYREFTNSKIDNIVLPCRVTGLHPSWSRFAIYYATIFVLHFIGEIMTVGVMGVFFNPQIANSTSALILSASVLIATGFLRHVQKPNRNFN